MFCFFFPQTRSLLVRTGCDYCRYGRRGQFICISVLKALLKYFEHQKKNLNLIIYPKYNFVCVCVFSTLLKAYGIPQQV